MYVECEKERGWRVRKEKRETIGRGREKKENKDISKVKTQRHKKEKREQKNQETRLKRDMACRWWKGGNGGMVDNVEA